MASLWHLCLLGLLARGGALKVLVTGAGGRTGSLVFSALKQQADITPLGLARSNKAVRTLKKAGATEAEIVQADVSDLTSLKAAMEGCDGVVLCTSVSREPSLTHLLGNCAVMRDLFADQLPTPPLLSLSLLLAPTEISLRANLLRVA